MRFGTNFSGAIFLPQFGIGRMAITGGMTVGIEMFRVGPLGAGSGRATKEASIEHCPAKDHQKPDQLHRYRVAFRHKHPHDIAARADRHGRCYRPL